MKKNHIIAEIILIIITLSIISIAIYLCVRLDISQELKLVIILSCLFLFLIIALLELVLEKKGALYKCRKCGYEYNAKYSQLLFSEHIGTKRYLRCPQCDRKS